MNISELKNSLNQFLFRISQIRDGDYDEKLKSSIYLDYKEIYSLYSSVPKEIIDPLLTQKEIAAIDALSLGLEKEEEFNKIISKFQKNNHTSLEKVVDFIKSRQGFELINGNSNFDKYSDDDLVEIFGGLFGVKIAKECVKSLRAEKVGRVVGYALSGLFNEHLEEFNKLQQKNPYVDFASFLKDKIQTHDIECSYTFHTKNKELEIHCNLNPFKNAKITEVRGHNRVDHCFVNHKEKTITFGQSSSNKNTEQQKDSFFKAYINLKELTSRKEVDGAPNPYFGYKLNPYFLFAGRFVVDDMNVTQEKGRDFKKLFQDSSKNELEDLAHMQYYRLFGNSKNPAEIQALSEFNVFIAGCDTLKLYENLEKKSLKQSHDEKQQFVFEQLTSYLQNVSNTLSSSKIEFVWGVKDNLQLYMNDIHAISQEIFTNFPKEINQNEYEQHIMPIHQSLQIISKNLKDNAGPEFNQIYRSIIDLNKHFSCLNNFNERIQEIKEDNISQYEKIIWRDSVKILDETKLISPSQLSFLPKIAEFIAQEYTGSQGKKFIQDFSKRLQNKLSFDESPPKTFRQLKYSFVTDFKEQYPDFVNFIEKSSFVFDKRLTPEVYSHRSHELNEYIYTELSKKFPGVLHIILDDLNKKIKNKL